MENLILNSLEIRRFRGFEHLRIEHLSCVSPKKFIAQNERYLSAFSVIQIKRETSKTNP